MGTPKEPAATFSSSTVVGASTKDDIGPSLLVELPPPYGLLQSQNGDGVGAGDEQEIVTATRKGSRLDLQRHFLGRDQALAWCVTALFWHLLVFDLNCLGTRLLVLLYGAAHVERVAVTRVAIGEDGYVHGADQVVDPLQHFRKGGQAGVGQTYVGSHVGITAEIDRLEPRPLDEPGRNHVVTAGRDENLVTRQEFL